MAKSKIKKDLIKNVVLAIIIVGILYFLQTLVYKFIGFDLWDILKVKKEEFKDRKPIKKKLIKPIKNMKKPNLKFERMMKKIQHNNILFKKKKRRTIK